MLLMNVTKQRSCFYSIAPVLFLTTSGYAYFCHPERLNKHNIRVNSKIRSGRHEFKTSYEILFISEFETDK